MLALRWDDRCRLALMLALRWDDRCRLAISPTAMVCKRKSNAVHASLSLAQSLCSTDALWPLHWSSSVSVKAQIGEKEA